MGTYIGPNNGEGITLYIDGEQVASDTIKSGRSGSAEDGKIVVGRYFADRDERYSSVMVDELLFFNASLTNDDVQLIYNSV